MSRKKLSALKRDAVVDDIKALIERHDVSPYMIGRLAQLVNKPAIQVSRPQ